MTARFLTAFLCVSQQEVHHGYLQDLAADFCGSGF
jgi:hypothetical protein